jgi:HSP20 family protein
MSLIKWNDRPWLTSATSLFDDFFNEDNRLNKVLSTGTSMPAANITETEDAFTVALAAPGKTKEDFKIEVDDNVLSISSESEDKTEKEEKNYTLREYSYNSFSRSFRLPKNANAEKIEAKYKDGVLFVDIAKTASSKPTVKTIPVA